MPTVETLLWSSTINQISGNYCNLVLIFDITQKFDIMRQSLEMACWLWMAFWSNNVGSPTELRRKGSHTVFSTESWHLLLAVGMHGISNRGAHLYPFSQQLFSSSQTLRHFYFRLPTYWKYWKSIEFQNRFSRPWQSIQMAKICIKYCKSMEIIDGNEIWSIWAQFYWRQSSSLFMQCAKLNFMLKNF